MEIELKPFDYCFFKLSFEWLQDDEIKYFLGSPEVDKDSHWNWYNSLSLRSDYYVWGVLYNGKPIGVVGIKNIKDSVGEYWGYIGLKEYWNRGLGRGILQLIFSNATMMNILILNLKVLKFNIRAIKLYTNLGFCQVSEDDKFIYMNKIL